MSEFGFLPPTAVGAGIAGLALAWVTYLYVKSQPPGNEMMQELGAAIHTGAMTLLKREYSYLLPFLVVVAVLLGLALS